MLCYIASYHIIVGGRSLALGEVRVGRHLQGVLLAGAPVRYAHGLHLEYYMMMLYRSIVCYIII